MQILGHIQQQFVSKCHQQQSLVNPSCAGTTVCRRWLLPALVLSHQDEIPACPAPAFTQLAGLAGGSWSRPLTQPHFLNLFVYPHTSTGWSLGHRAAQTPWLQPGLLSTSVSSLCPPHICLTQCSPLLLMGWGNRSKRLEWSVRTKMGMEESED